ncbi:MAG TPA: hypothetical protein VFM82_12480 [Flavobacteriaceae bacterium]|nr:hypothetical protein [Flavobacteriaceae bacterium]
MKVKNLEHLILLSTNTNGDFEQFYMLIANGLAKSSKRILYDPEHKEFSIINEIDESFQEVKLEDLSEEILLLEAIEEGMLFKSSI